MNVPLEFGIEILFEFNLHEVPKIRFYKDMGEHLVAITEITPDENGTFRKTIVIPDCESILVFSVKEEDMHLLTFPVN